jgi:Rrf2 family transcriptional regulator, nitric oxide-sensitive transcriptional repressor
MISLTAEYALRAVAWLAQQPGNSHTVHEIARATEMPPEYLAKVLQELARAALVVSQRGPTGGYRLARAADDITVLDVVQAVNPLHRLHDCPIGNSRNGRPLCALHQVIDNAIAGVEKAFRGVSIADLLRHPDRSALRCVTDRLCARPVSEGAVTGGEGDTA